MTRNSFESFQLKYGWNKQIDPAEIKIVLKSSASESEERENGKKSVSNETQQVSVVQQPHLLEGYASITEGKKSQAAGEASKEQDMQISGVNTDTTVGVEVDHTELSELCKENKEMKMQISDLQKQLAEAVLGQEKLREHVSALADIIGTLKLNGPRDQEIIESHSCSTQESNGRVPEPRGSDVKRKGKRTLVMQVRSTEKPSYSDAVTSSMKSEAISSKKLDVMARKTLSKPTEVQNFTRVLIQLPSNRELSRCPKAQKNSMVRKILKQLGIHRKVALFSLMGSSALEVYVPGRQLELVTSVLKGKGLTYEKDCAVLHVPTYGKQADVNAKVVCRLSYLYRRSTTQNLRLAILQGLPEALQQQVVDRARSLELSLKKRKAKPSTEAEKRKFRNAYDQAQAAHIVDDAEWYKHFSTLLNAADGDGDSMEDPMYY